MKINKKLISYIFIIIFSLTCLTYDIITIRKKDRLFTLFDDKEEVYEPVIENNLEEIKINEKENNRCIVYIGESVQLTLTNPAANQKVNAWNFSFNSSNGKIANVSANGLVHGNAEGECIIKVTNKSDPNVYDIVTIKVIDKNELLNFLNKYGELISIIHGETMKLELNTGGDVALNDLIWSSSDENICTVSNGFIYGKDIGISTITVESTKTGKKDTITIRVYNEKHSVQIPTKIYLNSLFVNSNNVPLSEIETYKFNVGDKVIVNSSCDTQNNSLVDFKVLSPNLTLINQDAHVATITCDALGEAFVSITSSFDPSIEYLLKINVVKNDVSSFELKEPILTENTVNLNINELTPLNIYDGDTLIEFSDYIVTSSDNTIVDIIDNCLNPVAPGTATITATYKYNSEINTTFNVIVNNENYVDNSTHRLSIEKIKLNGELTDLSTYTTHNLIIGDKIEIDFVISPYYNIIKDYAIYSSNNHIVSVTTTVDNNKYHLVIECVDYGEASVNIHFFDLLDQSLCYNFHVDNTIFDFSISAPLNINVGNTGIVSTQITNSLSKNVKLEFTSSNPQYLQVGNSGELLAIKEGKSTIGVKAYDDDTVIYLEKEINVKQTYLKVEPSQKMDVKTFFKHGYETIPVDFNSTMLNLNQVAYFSINTDGPSNYEIIVSDNQVIDIVYVDYTYQIYPIKAGTTNITIKNYENPSLDYSFDVNVCEVLPKYVISTLENNELIEGETTKLSLLIDSNATYSKINYSYSNEGIVEIKNDTVIAKQPGVTTVTLAITDKLETYSISFVVKVSPKAINQLSDYSTTEIIGFVILHVIIYTALVVYLGMLLKELKLNKIISAVIVILTPLLIGLFAEFIKYGKVITPSYSFALILNCSLIVLISTIFIIIRGVKHEN